MQQIKKLVSKKYSFSNLNKNQILNFYNLKKNFLNKKLVFIKNEKLKYNHKIYNTEKYLYYLLNKTKLNNYDHKFLNKIYIKFNINLKLKKKYDKKLKKIDNQNTSYKSYLYLGNLIKYIKNLENIHKLNTVLKINDLIFLKSNKIKIKDKIFLSNLIKYEIYLIKKYL